MRFETGKDAKNATMPDYQRLLEDAVKFHGHLCGGQSIGVRMAMAGLRELGIDNPRGEEGKDLIIFVETDRCVTDAVISVTGRTPGKRSVKWVDYGKMAATFVYAGTGKAVRISVRPDAHEKALRIAQTCAAEVDEKTAFLSALASIPEEELLRIQNVHVVLRPQDLPGKPQDGVCCETCGETVWDMRAVHSNGKVLCKPCAEMRAYYTVRTEPPRLGMSEANPEGGLSCEKDEMGLPEIDWNECWRVAQGKKDIPKRDPEFWNRRAPSFARNVLGSDYIGQFLDIIKPVPDWTVLDIGCAAGTLAVPLAPLVKSITAIDPSTRMLSLLEDRCREHGITNIRILEGGWEDDWDALDVGIHDVAIASRSLIVEDLRGAIRKLENCARNRVYLSTLVDDGPHDRRIVEATGRRFQEGPDYILVYNLLRSMGIYANVAFTVHREEKTYSDVEDALSAMSWMIHGMTPEEEDRLRRYLRQHLVEHNGRWKLPYQRIVRWAVLWWEKMEQEGRQ